MNVENDEMGDRPDDENLDGEYADDEYSDDEYADDEYSDDEYADGEYADDEYADDEYADDDQLRDEEFEDSRESSRGSSSRSKKKKRRMFCGGCNRIENHRRSARSSWLNSYVTGLTFGLNRLVGPFKCTCCGSNRWIIRLKKSNAVIVKSKSKR